MGLWFHLIAIDFSLFYIVAKLHSLICYSFIYGVPLNSAIYIYVAMLRTTPSLFIFLVACGYPTLTLIFFSMVCDYATLLLNFGYGIVANSSRINQTTRDNFGRKQ